jgi:ribosomal protein S24E
MSLIETVSDVNNTFLARRELTCNFAGLGGKLKKIEAIDMISKEFKLDGKVIIPIKLQTHVGKPLITGTFYVYEDEKLAKEHVNPAIFSRLEKANKPAEEAPAKETAEEKKEDAGEAKKEEPAKEVKTEEKPEEPPKETKAEEKKEEVKESE